MWKIADANTDAIASNVRARSLAEVAELLVETSNLASVLSRRYTASCPLHVYEYTSTSAPVIGSILRKALDRGVSGHVHFTIGKGNGSFSVDKATSVDQLQKYYDVMKAPRIAVTVVPSKCSLAPQGWPASFFHIMCINLSLPFVVDDDNVLSSYYRLLKPGGELIMASWKSLGWSDEREIPHVDPALSIQPSSGWKDKPYIIAKLQKHQFVDIRLEAYELDRRTTEEEFWSVMQAFIRAAASRLIGASTTESVEAPDSQATQAIAEQMYERCKDWTYTGHRIVWIIHAAKANSNSPSIRPRASGSPTPPALRSPPSPPLCAI